MSETVLMFSPEWHELKAWRLNLAKAGPIRDNRKPIADVVADMVASVGIPPRLVFGDRPAGSLPASRSFLNRANEVMDPERGVTAKVRWAERRNRTKPKPVPVKPSSLGPMPEPSAWVKCRDCDGEGFVLVAGAVEDCRLCDGRGDIRR